MPEKILLLGHSKENTPNLIRTLTTLNHQPLTADWTNFTPRAYHRRDRPTAILADIDHPSALPVGELCDQVRKLWGAHYPIIALTASKKVLHISMILDAGVDDCLPHNPPQQLLDRKITRCIKQNTAPAASELTEEVPDSLLGVFLGNPGLIRLGDLVTIHPGATPRRPWCRRAMPPDHDWRGVITSDAMDKFHLGKPGNYLLWSRLHLFRLPGPEEYSVPEKVLLSRSGPPLAAAVDKSRLPAGADVYSLVPREGIGAAYVACLLNSRLLDFYFNRLADNPDGRLRPESIRETPVPRPTGTALQDFSRYATLLAHFGPNPQNWIDRQSKDEILEQMENAVFSLYGVGREAREGLAAMHF